jgi:hypothetical protein
MTKHRLYEHALPKDSFEALCGSVKGSLRSGGDPMADAHRELGEMFLRLHVREFICNGAKYCSIYELDEAWSIEGEQLGTLLEAACTRLRLCMQIDILMCVPWLCLDLPNDPKIFNKELKSILKIIKNFMKIIHRVPNHRVPLHHDRDRELWEFKKRNPRLTWGQLGYRFGMSNGAAELAF